MKTSLIVGLTYDLISDYALEESTPEDEYSEFDSDETIDRLEAAIAELGYTVRRIGDLHKLIAFLMGPQHVDVVFNIAEGRRGRSRESQIPSLLEGYNIPYTFSDPLTLGLSLDKVTTKQLWRQAGLPVAPFCTVETVADYQAPLQAGLAFPLFVKPLWEGSSKGVRQESVVKTLKELKEQVERVVTAYQQPALVEEYLPGREFTVGVIGSGQNAKVLGAVELIYVAPCTVNGFTQKRDNVCRTLTPVTAEADLEKLTVLSLNAYRVLGCRDASRLDIRMDKYGQPNLMEINTLPGLSAHSSLPLIAANAGLSFSGLLSIILDGAIARGSINQVK
jgi:D-alanine-D-alanine ligase